MLVVVGAGAALLVALLLTKVSVFQHAVALLALGALGALMHVAFPQQIELLLQPAAAGLILAVLAVLIEHRLSSDQPLGPVFSRSAHASRGSGAGSVPAEWGMPLLPAPPPSSQASVEAAPR